ncbi:unnamed protein product [Rotaria magnacalcarata]|uniref:Uncharacterized protein n=1 Tax=Rotaria magnacalcarata TaxID=392030 RepID=A0A816W883_9BILA|nr:unnamed protein product [Rotaria magnacalcarata]CAF3778209.1 unnamed protein product [Rotaria magnacalcarata]
MSEQNKIRKISIQIRRSNRWIPFDYSYKCEIPIDYSCIGHNDHGGFDERTGEPKDFTGIPPTFALRSPDDATYEPHFNTDRFGPSRCHQN